MSPKPARRFGEVLVIRAISEILGLVIALAVIFLGFIAVELLISEPARPV
jgi:flagellin-like protein